MNRPKQFLIDECDSSVIDYIKYLEDVEKHYNKILMVLEGIPIDIDECIEGLKMDRSDFMSLLYKEVQFFETRCNRGQRSDTPQYWPNEMEENDWWDQFMAHLEMQGKI